MDDNFAHGIRRRGFLKAAIAVGAVGVPAFLLRGEEAHAQDDESPAAVSSGAPSNVSATVTIPGAGEPGDALLLAGVILAADGRTPLKDAVLYVYHTDITGVYNRADGHWRRPRLRGWMKVGADGRYELRSIRPGSYPSSRVPQHIHAIVSAPGVPAQWIEEFRFEDDPYVSAEEKSQSARNGRFAHVLKMSRSGDGAWRGTREIRVK